MKNDNIISRFFKVTVIVFFALFATATYAQDDTGFEDDVNDEPETNINSLVAFGLIAGAGLGYTLLKRNS